VLEAATDVARAALGRGIGRPPGLAPDPAVAPGSVGRADPGSVVAPDALDILLEGGN
jgi:hypothetical protein